MDHVLLLNNECYVDSIKDTWAERAGHHAGTLGGSARAAPCTNLEFVTKCSACRFFCMHFAIGDPRREICSCNWRKG